MYCSQRQQANWRGWVLHKVVVKEGWKLLDSIYPNTTWFYLQNLQQFSYQSKWPQLAKRLTATNPAKAAARWLPRRPDCQTAATGAPRHSRRRRCRMRETAADPPPPPPPPPTLTAPPTPSGYKLMISGSLSAKRLAPVHPTRPRPQNSAMQISS